MENGHQADVFRFDSLPIPDIILDVFDKDPVIESETEMYAFTFKMDFIDRIFSGLKNLLNGAFIEEKDFLEWKLDFYKYALASDYWHMVLFISDGILKQQTVLNWIGKASRHLSEF